MPVMKNPSLRWEDFIASCTRRVAAMDEIDRHAGRANPLDVGYVEAVAACMAALEAGYKTADWKCVGDAWVMLDQLKRVLAGI